MARLRSGIIVLCVRRSAHFDSVILFFSNMFGCMSASNQPSASPVLQKEIQPENSTNLPVVVLPAAHAEMSEDDVNDGDEASPVKSGCASLCG